MSQVDSDLRHSAACRCRLGSSPPATHVPTQLQACLPPARHASFMSPSGMWAQLALPDASLDALIPDVDVILTLTTLHGQKAHNCCHRRLPLVDVDRRPMQAGPPSIEPCGDVLGDARRTGCTDNPPQSLCTC